MKKQCTILISAIMILLFVFTGCQSTPAEADMDAPKVIGVLNHQQAWELFTGIFGSETRGADGFATECNDDLDGDGNADYAVMDSYGSTVTVELSSKGKIIADSAELNVNGDRWGKNFLAFGADVTSDDQREIILLINIGQQGPESRCGLFVYEKSGDEYKPISAPSMGHPITVEWDCEMLAVYRRFTADMEPEKDGYSVMVSDAAGMEAYYAARDSQKRWLEIKDTPITNDLAAFEYCDAMPTYINSKPALALCQYVKGPDVESWERLGYFVTIITWDDQGNYEIADEFFAAPLFAKLAANKDGSNSINSVTETKSEVWKETYTAGGWLPVSVDAVMDIPLYVNYPVYKMEYYNFTTGNLGRIAEAIIGSVSDIKLAEDYSETKNASETQFSPMAKYTCKDEAGNQWKVVTRESNTTISAYADKEYVIQSEETVLAGNAYTGEPVGTTLDNVKISQEEAIQEVQDVMDKLGICNMGLSHIEKARMLDPSNNTLTEGWYLRYMRCDGDRDTIPFLTSHTVFTDFENEFEPLRKESLLVFVDETGIVSFSWYSPSQQIASITDTQPPLTFAEAKDSIKATIEEIAIVTKDKYSPECTLTIKNILLSNCVVQSEFESYTGYLLPTWIVEFVIDHGDGWTDNEQLYISSIDGSKLSNFCMTEAGKRIATQYDNELYIDSDVSSDSLTNPLYTLSDMDLLINSSLVNNSEVYALPRTLSGNDVSVSIWDKLLGHVNEIIQGIVRPYDAAGAAYNVVAVSQNANSGIRDVYVIATYRQYEIIEDDLSLSTEWESAIRLTFREKQDGEIEFVGMVVPKESWYTATGLAKDQADFWPKMLEEYVQDFSIGREERLKAIEEQIAISMANTANVDTLLSTIVSSPKDSSAPIDYIHEHVGEYAQLCAMGRRAVSRFLPRFESGRETGLEGQIMAIVFNALTGIDSVYNYENGQAWYDANKEEVLVSEWVEAVQPTSTPEPQPTPAPTASVSSGSYEPPVAGRTAQATADVNIRSGPGTHYDKLGQLKKGEIVPQIGSVNEWIKIHWDGQTAYVHEAYCILNTQAQERVSSLANALDRSGYFKKNADIYLGMFGDPLSDVFYIRVSSGTNVDRITRDLSALLVDESGTFKVMESSLPSYVNEAYIRELMNSISQRVDSLSAADKALCGFNAMYYDPAEDEFIVELLDMDDTKIANFRQLVSSWEYITFVSGSAIAIPMT